MVEYIATAVALKGFSSSVAARRLYRALGNRAGNSRRSSGTMPGYYPERVKRMLRLQRRYELVREGDHILELGTGWLHWEALTLRLFCNIKATLFDVWDNRQLGGMKNYLRQLDSMLSDGFELSDAEVKRANSLIESILKVDSFAQLYDLLGFQYVVESSGSLAQFPSESFHLVLSAGVLEHVKREATRALIWETYRLLKPGGWAVHSIDTSDHLQHYDRKVSPKRYLSFSEETWRRLFENEVQYINRMQRCEWLQLFEANGFHVADEEARRVDINRLRLASRYKNMALSDLECTVFKVALRRPSAVSSSVTSAKVRKG